MDFSKYSFLEHLWFKSKFYNNILLRVPNGTPTTQTCSCCGNILKNEFKLTLKDRLYKCDKCGLELDRDINSSRNIRNLKFS